MSFLWVVYLGNWKQWKWKPGMENGNGKQKWSKLDANECKAKTFD